KDLAGIGAHWERAGETEKARPCYLEGARRAARIYSYQEAERLYRAVLRLVDGPSQDGVVARNELGKDVLRMQGRAKGAEQQITQALGGARQLGLRRAEVVGLGQLAALRTEAGQLEEGSALSEQTLRLAREVGDRRAEGSILAHLAGLRSIRGRIEEARAL